MYRIEFHILWVSYLNCFPIVTKHGVILMKNNTFSVLVSPVEFYMHLALLKKLMILNIGQKHIKWVRH